MPNQRRTGPPAPVVLAALCAALMIAHQVAAKTVRDALFLSNLSAHDLPKAMLTAALLGGPAVLATSAGMTRFGPGRLIPNLLAASGALHALEWWLLERTPVPTAVLVYLHVSIAGAIGISGLWSIINERFDPHAARRAVGVISGSAGAGGVVGGLLVHNLSGPVGLRPLLAALAVTSLISAVGTQRLGASSAAAEGGAVDRSALRSIASSPYLRSLAGVIALASFSGALIDYAFKSQAADSMASGPALARFFAVFYMVTSVGTVVFQLTLARRMLDRVGLGGTLATLPAAVLVLGAFGLAAPGLNTLTLLFGAETTLQNSSFRSAYELLYTPLAPAAKRSVKTVIDVACDRLGEVLASALILGLLALVTRLAPNIGLGVALAGAAGGLWLSLRLQHGYVAELAASLRNGKVKLDASRTFDLTTRVAMSQTQLEVDRAELLRQIAQFREDSAGEPSLTERLPGAAVLASGDPVRIRALLAEPVLDRRLVSLVVPLLAVDDLAPDATQALRSVGPRITGQLLDTLLDAEAPLKLRRRIPRILRSCPTPRAARGLADALSDPVFEIRVRSALALHNLIEQDERLRPPRRLIFAAAQREVDAQSGSWEPKSSRRFATDPPEAAGSSQPVLRDRGLEHVFTLLGLALDREALELARRALASSDDKLRGTALEYLENVVPEPVRTALWKYLERPREPRPSTRRPTPEIVDDLKRSIG